MQTYIVANNTRGPVSFNLYPSVDTEKLKEVNAYHRRRGMRGSIIKVTIPHGASKDLAELLSVKELKNNVELHQLIKNGKLFLIDKPEEVKEKVPVEEEPKEVELPKEESPPVIPEEEPKPKKSTNKKSKKKATKE